MLSVTLDAFAQEEDDLDKKHELAQNKTISNPVKNDLQSVVSTAMDETMPGQMILSPKKQLDFGVAPDEIVCRDDRILVLRTNGFTVCVTEKTAEKTGWKIIENKIEKIQNSLSSESMKTLEFDYGSDVPYVDDGRESHRAVLQKSPAPWDVYDHIIEQREKHSVDDSGLFRTPAESHVKYSIKEGMGFYPEDWLPTHVPDGYRLLYIDNNHYADSSGNVWLRAYYVPNNFILNENTTKAMGYDSWGGFSLSVKSTSSPLDEYEDIIEGYKERFESESGYEGRFLDLTRNGKTIIAFEAQSNFNHYAASFGYPFDEYTAVAISSNHLSLEELQPIFDSMMSDIPPSTPTLG